LAADHTLSKERPMARELGGSQISALLESVPGIANVLRSPVADALVGMIRAGAGIGEFDPDQAKELVQYAVRRGLIHPREGDELLADVEDAGAKRRSAQRAAKRAAKKSASGKRPAAKPAAKAPKKPPKKAPVKKPARPAGKRTGRPIKKAGKTAKRR
jgi:hypothetical protein